MMEGQYEARYLLMMLKYIMNDESMPEVMRPINWEHVYRLANFQDVAHLVYYTALARTVDITEAWIEKFRQRYQEAVICEERTRKVKEVLEWQLEQHKIHNVFLNSNVICPCYKKPEMCGQRSIDILVEKGRNRAIADFMKDMDYVLRETESDGALVYQRVAGVTVRFYDRLEFNTKKMSQYYSFYLSRLRIKEGMRYTHEFQTDTFYVYYMSTLAYHYAKGSITVQMVLNLWVFFQAYKDFINWPAVQKELEKMDVWEFTGKLGILSDIWFTDGYRLDSETDTLIYEAMEEYILTRGELGRQESAKLLPLFAELADIELRNERKERLHRIIKWTFPDRGYMQKIYPSVEKYHFLMYPFWMHRLLRTFVRYVMFCLKTQAKRAWKRLCGFSRGIKDKVKGVRNAIADKFKKKDEPQ